MYRRCQNCGDPFKRLWKGQCQNCKPMDKAKSAEMQNDTVSQHVTASRGRPAKVPIGRAEGIEVA